ncbi:ring finger domain-containing protein [Cryptosporidium canis]|uniref:RING-type E3 ubiquitin transferase n=1 Tax=Cryptosporidium canis TaxID=195482 RepID=A0A9D5HVV4_9CRYT|nr:ring finger domain-containing protein [Cryptosporidium canis]
MEHNAFISRQSRGDGVNFWGGVRTCQFEYPEARYQHSYEHASRPFTPLRDITGSIFGGLVRDSRTRSLQEQSMFSRSRNSMGDGAYRVNPMGQESRFFGQAVGGGGLGVGAGVGGGAGGGGIQLNSHINDARAFNRSLSMSSPNISLGFLEEARDRSRESIENNSGFVNRSRSFADRIMEQFDILDRERSMLAERIQRNQMFYEQMRSNDTEMEGIFNSLSGRIQRHAQRGEGFSERSGQRRPPVGSRPGGECSRNISLNHRFYSRPEDLESNARGGSGESDIIEVIQVDDDDLPGFISRRNLDIRNRSLIIAQEEIVLEESEDEGREFGGSEDERSPFGDHSGSRRGTQDDYDEESSDVERLLRRIRGRIAQEDTVRVPMEIQNALPVSKFNASRSQNLDDDKKMCLICLDEFKDRQEIVWLPCTHCFCRECITSWFERGTTCPICKDDLLDHFQ